MNPGKTIVIVALILVAILPGEGAQAWVGKEIHDWSVQCSNGLTCTLSFANLGAKGVQVISFRRKGSPAAPVELSLRVVAGFAPDSQPDVTYLFKIDGREVLTLNAKSFHREERNSAFFFSEEVRVAALIEAMKGGKMMEVAVSGRGGAEVLLVKLNGFEGAMLYADQVQDRIGRIDALEAKGDTVAPKNAIAKDILTLDDLPEVVRRDFTGSGSPCGGLDPTTIWRFGGFDVAVGRARMIAVACGEGGPYNQPYALYIGYGAAVERTSFPYIQGGRPTTMNLVYNVGYNPLTRILTSFYKGRGIGDCGQLFTWHVNARTGNLEFLEERAKEDCDGKGNGPSSFPIIWEAKP